MTHVTHLSPPLFADTHLEHLQKVVSSQRFLNKQGLGNEVPFFICPYAAKDALHMEGVRKRLVKRLENKNIAILHINLYDIGIEILQNHGIWEDTLAVEASVTKDEFKEHLQSVLDPQEHIIPAIADKMQEQAFDVLFLSGVGEVFPYTRSHNILNNLQRVAIEKPTILFFPGEYTHSLEKGSSLDLFGKLHDDKYYRAFNIFHYEV